ncbi:MAG TPA: hypothetical protein VE604_08945 [Candidatus Polarisedimenticolia bacterium]|nr:hypothetical protein [Candidatus Polarisedimenticolia bacterium]
MSLKEWERDVLNRQRNIVFPDTNLNEGRFYRNIASGKAVFSQGQKISLLLIVFGCMSFYAFGLASSISAFLSQHNIGLLVVDLWSSMWLLGVLVFWIFLTVKGLFPVKRKRIVRGGYRRKRSKERWYGNYLSGGRTSTAGLRRKA